ncbi:MAG: hypothetical protein IKQ32_03520 [Prevotella sp.]|nr:hypothetical protein [Prevotella sp.]
MLMHVLLMAGIVNGYRITINSICVVPNTCMRHVIALPTFNCRLSTYEGAFNSVNSINHIVDIPYHV